MPAEAAHPSLKQRAVEETRKLITITVYLFLFLEAVTIYRSLILTEYGIDYARVGYVAIEALVLAKVILLGDLMHVGERSHGRKMVITILYKTVAFALLVGVFKVLEHFVVGLFHGQAPTAVWAELKQQNRDELLARVLLLFVGFIPFFMLREISRALGPGRLHALMFSPTPKA